MPSQLYTNAFIAVEGAVLLEHVTLTVTRNSGAQPVVTVGKGFSGMSPGAPTLEIDVTSAVPTAAFEFDGGARMKAVKEVELTVFAAGQRLVSKGFIVTDSFKHAANSESNYEFKFMGSYAEWSG